MLAHMARARGGPVAEYHRSPLPMSVATMDKRRRQVLDIPLALVGAHQLVEEELIYWPGDDAGLVPGPSVITPAFPNRAG